MTSELFDLSVHDMRVVGIRDQGLLVFSMSGRLHDSGFHDIEARIMSALTACGGADAILDLTGAENSCSLLMRLMVVASRKVAGNDGTFVVVAAPGSTVEEQLLLRRMDQMVTLAPDPVSARRLTGVDLSSKS